MMRLLRCLCVVCALLALVPGTVQAADYPQRPITLIVGFGAGGATDIMGRSFANLLGKELHGVFVVKNVPGAGGTMGAAELSAAAPDGYTLGYLPVGTMASQPTLRNLPYKWDAFTPICLVSDNPVAVVTTKKSPWKDFHEAVEDIRQHPGKYFFGSSGPGSSPHISMQALFSALGLKIGHMPAQDSASAIQALNSGTVQFYADPPVIVRQFDLKCVGIFADKRLESLPDVPTFKEMGIDVPSFSGWHAFWGPAGLPPEIVRTLETAARKVVASAAFKELCQRTDMQPTYLDSAGFSKFFADQYHLYEKYSAEFGLKKK